ncbi:chorismate-binding protein [Fodinicola feengrottensis]|uniref:isochorismate synthase n=1 Tax=Fodinicola feengrottensis TaxID=435914 RepID=A0ABN2FP53_9ACTN
MTSASPDASLSALPTTVRTTATATATGLLTPSTLPYGRAEDVLCWLHGDPAQGLLGWGEAARFEVSGPDRFARAAAWWDQTVARFEIDDQVQVAGSGPLLFGSFSFEDDDRSVLVMPRVVLGVSAGQAFVTTVDGADPSASTQPLRSPGPLTWSDGQVSDEAYKKLVAAAVTAIRSGDLNKVVTARDALARAKEPLDVRALLARLSARYPQCWTYAVDGLVGATPELLVRRQGDLIFSRVLAGTGWRGGAAGSGRENPDDAVTAFLTGSGKNAEEHRYAAVSAAEALGPYCAELDVPDQPSVLRLANVVHLSTDLTGRLARPVSVLELAGALHPTAAVCGTPTPVAAAYIRSAGGLDRDRYAGPTGWLDAAGNGEFGIALRCAQVSGGTARLYAGGGIVADSVPENELDETYAKLAALRDALENA